MYNSQFATLNKQNDYQQINFIAQATFPVSFIKYSAFRII